MKWLLASTLVFGAFAEGCSCNSNADAAAKAVCPQPNVVANGVKLELLENNSLTRKGVVQEYRITNSNNDPIYFVRPEASFGDPKNYYTPPFYELHEGDALSVYNYVAAVPIGTEPESLYRYTLRKVEPGEAFRGKIEIAGPLKFH